jgi:hypothetical protein
MNALALAWPWITLDDGQHIFKFERPDQNVSLCGRFTIVDENGGRLRLGLLPDDENRDLTGACPECLEKWNNELVKK